MAACPAQSTAFHWFVLSHVIHSHVNIIEVKGEVRLPHAQLMDRWSFCGVCKRNHEEGRKHIFSSHHKDKLSSQLAKFTKKVPGHGWYCIVCIV